jgi:predicted nuclease of predicted toxin-antitoxin system
MGVSYSVVQHLRDSGHDALHLRDVGMQRQPDDEVFATALRDQRIILTFDLDFGKLAASAGTKWPSVVIFRLNDTRVATPIERLTKALAVASGALLEGAVVVVDDGRVRVRELPID